MAYLVMGTAQIVDIAGMEDPKSSKDELCPPEIASGPLVASPAPNKYGAPMIEGLHKDKFPRIQYVEIKEGTLRMLPDEWLAIGRSRQSRNSFRRR